MNHALVAGATGTVGRYLLQHLAAQPDWKVLALSRRPPDVPGRFRHLPVDLEDAAGCLAALSSERNITHVFYAAYVPDADPVRLIARNAAMFANLVTAVEAASPALAHVHLVEGTKWYGSHLGPFTTPAKESHPRHAGGNFYFDQQDWVERRQRGRAWTWSAIRPHAVCGFSVGSAMNLALALAVYGSLCRELELPFSHPGPAENFHALYQLTDSGLLARAMTWMATAPGCANTALNVTNGDLIRWRNVWPRLADFFGVEPGPQRHFSLREAFGDRAETWQAIVARHGLQPLPYAQIAGWGFADFVFGSTWDIVSDTGNARRAGFTETVDSEDMLLALLAEFRRGKVIP
ncbi:MAG: SDR family oxidoreductase [Burkholderiales bacterium]|nr:SDR family oxidoreductase [Burkholderiales bacterium]